MTTIEKINAILDFLNGGETTWDQAHQAALDMKETYNQIMGIIES